MSENKFELQMFCTPHNLVRSTYFSDTYRAVFELDTVVKQWDITHISLPFTEEKERQLKSRFGIRQEDIFHFYKQFSKCVQNSLNIVKYISEIPPADLTNEDDGQNKKDPAAAVKSSAALFKYKRILAKTDQHGSDVYLVTETMEPFVGSEFCNGSAITLNNLMSFAARAAQIINGFAVYGFHIGAFDLDTVFLQNVDGRKFFTFGSFLYAGFDKEKVPPYVHTPPWPDVVGLPTLPSNADSVIREGGAPSLVTDMHALVGLLWTILSGNHYRGAPDFSQMPKYAPKDLADMLIQGKDSNDPDMLRLLSKKFHAVMRSIKREEIPNSIIHMMESRPPKIIEPQEVQIGKIIEADRKAEPQINEPLQVQAGQEAETPNAEAPIKPPEPVEPTTPVEPAKPLEPVEPAKPLEPVEPEKPSEPVEPTKPVEPIKLTEVMAEIVTVAIPTDNAEAASTKTDGTEQGSAVTGSEVKRGVLSPAEPSASQGEGGPTANAQSVPERTETPKNGVSAPMGENEREKREGGVERTPSIRTESPQVQPTQPAFEVPPQGMPMYPPGAYFYPVGVPIPYNQPIPGQPGYVPVYPQSIAVMPSPAAQSVNPLGTNEQKSSGTPTQATAAQVKQKTGTKKSVAKSQPANAAHHTKPVKSGRSQPQRQQPIQKAGTSPISAMPKANSPQAEPPAAASSDKQNPPKKAGRKVIRRTITYKKAQKRNPIVTVLLSLFLILLLGFFGACGLQFAGYDLPYRIPFVDELSGASSFTVTPETIVLKVGEEVVLTSSEGCTLNSSDHSVAEVSDTGSVKGIGPGTCTIIARASSSSAVVKVQVTVYP